MEFLKCVFNLRKVDIFFLHIYLDWYNKRKEIT